MSHDAKISFVGSCAADMRADGGMRVAIYTSTFSDYDILMSPLKTTPGCSYIALTDTPQSFTRHWRFRPLPDATRNMAQNEANRYCKLFPNRLLPEWDVSIYVDGNILILQDLSPLIKEFLESDADIALFPGQYDRTVAEEITLTLERDKVRPERRNAALEQLSYLRERGFDGLPITMNGVLFRRHDRPRLDELMEAWWNDINRFAMRDQFSLPGLLATSDVAVHHWGWQYFHQKNPYFHVYSHRIGRPRILSDAVFASRVRSQFDTLDSIAWRAYRRLRNLASKPFR